MVSQGTHHGTQSSNTPLSYASSPPSDSNFAMPMAHQTKWQYFDEASKVRYFSKSKSSLVDVPTYSQPQWSTVSNSSSLGSVNSDNSASSNRHHVELAKITGYQTGSISQAAKRQSGALNQKRSYPPTLSTYQPDPYPSPSPKREEASHRRSPLARANSGSDKSLSRSSSSQSPFHPKRRMSAFGTPEASHSTPFAEPDLLIEEVSIKEPKAKHSAKISHSITERRYRGNLNSKFLQLDQTLSSTRGTKDQAQKSEGQDEQLVETPVKARKSRKADVLNEAIRYVKQADRESEARIKEIELLRLRVAALEKLVNCGDCVLLKQFAGQQINRQTDLW